MNAWGTLYLDYVEPTLSMGGVLTSFTGVVLTCPQTRVAEDGLPLRITTGSGRRP